MLPGWKRTLMCRLRASFAGSRWLNETYTHRIAISNARLIRLVDGVVQFRWKDYADRGRTKMMALSVEEFLRRFLVHVLPRGFVRIRHFGLLANAQRRTTIAQARQWLGAIPPTTSPDDSRSADGGWTRCPVCRQGSWHVEEILRPIASSMVPCPDDTS